MQAQMQGMPPQPEPSDEELKDAIWIVLSAPSDPRSGPPPQIGPKLKAHLAAGGSAMILGMPRGDALADVLKDWGVQLHTDALAVHEVAPTAAAAASRDIAENAQRVPYIFVLNQYGDHLIAEPLKSLDMLGIYLSPVTTSAAAGVKTTPLLPLPNTPPSWGETDVESIDSDAGPKKGDGDLPPPLFGAAAAEKGGSRVVTVGGVQSFTNEILNVPDVEASKAQRRFVARFPGNAEFFANAVFWLAHRETLIAISPAAMEVPRIRDMGDGALAGVRVGVLLVGLPLAVVAAGLMVFFARRD